jgi:hypothetical protein
MSDTERIRQLEQREIELCKMMSKATVRLAILRDRMRYCGKTHGLSLFEIEGWIEEHN